MPLNRHAASAFTFAVAALAGLPALALDEVVRQSDGQSVRGNVTAVTKAEITLEAAGRSTTVPATDVANVRWDGEPPQLNLTRTRETNGDLAFALDSYRQILAGLPADKPNLRADVEFLIARTLAKQAIGDPAQKDAAVKALNDFLAQRGDFFRFYEALSLLGRVHVAAGDYDAARSAYDRLAQSPLPELKMAAQNALARLKLRQDDLPGALADFDAVASQKADTPATSRERFSAQLGKATVLQRQGNHAGALGVLGEVIDAAAPDATSVQAEAFLRQGDSLLAQGQDKDALLSYLHVDLLFPMESEAHAESLYHLTRLWTTVGQADRSADTRRRLTEKYAGSEWTKKLTTPAAE